MANSAYYRSTAPWRRCSSSWFLLRHLYNSRRGLHFFVVDIIIAQLCFSMQSNIWSIVLRRRRLLKILWILNLHPDATPTIWQYLVVIWHHETLNFDELGHSAVLLMSGKSGFSDLYYISVFALAFIFLSLGLALSCFFLIHIFFSQLLKQSVCW